MTPVLVFDLCLSYLAFAVSYAVLHQVFAYWNWVERRRVACR